jgi:hypothetical protein
LTEQARRVNSGFFNRPSICRSDFKVDASAKAPLRFTFFWLKDRRWEHIDYMVAVGRQA